MSARPPFPADDPARGRWQHALDGTDAQCDLCPRACRLADGQRGFCFVRRNERGSIRLDAYGRTFGLALDPIEKKPLYHVLPGAQVASFGTIGCNEGCLFCQNADISRCRSLDALRVEASPSDVAAAAVRAGAQGVAFTYNDPVVFAEYAIDTAHACHDQGILAVAVTGGFIAEGAREEFFSIMDAANIDLKAFRADVYRDLCGVDLAAVLDTIAYAAREAATWVELTTLVIPGYNDDEKQLRNEFAWIRERCGSDTPLHLTAFHPAYRMRDTPPTSAATLARARTWARAEGLRFVYTGNVHDRAGSTTRCPTCGGELVVRDGFSLAENRLAPGGRCPACGVQVPGVWNGAIASA